MAQFLIRLVNYFASELITKRLANSRSFQRFAVKTHDKVQAAKGIMEDPAQARQALKEAEKAMREVTSNTTTAAQEGSGSITSSFERFKRALREEVERDLRGGRKGRRK
ncbi:unnamed protein product [Sphacelaria rigidula]